MSDGVDIGVFMRRVGPVHAKQMASLAEMTQRSFNLIYVFEEGTAHENINKVLDRRTGCRWLVIMDDDVEFLTERWLDRMIQVMERHSDVGMLVPVEVKRDQEREKFLEEIRGHEETGLTVMSWNAGYVMLFDMDRLDGIRADEGIPGPSGMSDVDLSLQVRSQGYKCAVTPEVTVYHPFKPVNPSWRKRWDVVQEHELLRLSREQIAYMTEKWGPFFVSNRQYRPLGTRKS